jgi:hypothetical protein
VNGVSDTLRGWSERLGVTQNALRLRVAAGEPLARAFAPNHKRLHTFVAFGREQTLARWAEEYDLILNTLVWRMRRGLTLEQALTWQHGKQRRESASLRSSHLLTFGEVIDSKSGWAKRLGVHRNTLARAIKSSGWPSAIERLARM